MNGPVELSATVRAFLQDYDKPDPTWEDIRDRINADADKYECIRNILHSVDAKYLDSDGHLTFG